MIDNQYLKQCMQTNQIGMKEDGTIGRISKPSDEWTVEFSKLLNYINSFPKVEELHFNRK